MAQSLTLSLADERATLRCGAGLAACLRPGLKLYLHGDLGAGKTTLVRGVLRGLGFHGKVKSPTYTLVELYKLSKLDLYHFDFYRFDKPSEWGDSGLREMFAEAAVIMVEWPERAQALLPRADVDIALSARDAGRELHAQAHSALGDELIKAWRAQ